MNAQTTFEFIMILTTIKVASKINVTPTHKCFSFKMELAKFVRMAPNIPGIRRLALFPRYGRIRKRCNSSISIYLIYQVKKLLMMLTKTNLKL